MHDAPDPSSRRVTGLAAHPSSTLLERALGLMAEGPLSALTVANEVMGLRRAPESVASRLTAALLGADPRVGQLPDGRWALVAAAAGSPMVDDCAYAVVDVETTGGQSGAGDRLTEIAVVVVQGSRTELVLDSLVNPERPIPRIATSLTGITNAMVRGAPTFEELADQIVAALAGRVFVAHNARFDWGFLDRELKRSRDVVLSGPRLCTVRLARRLLRGQASCGLDSLTDRFGLVNHARHRAAGDAMVTAELLRCLLRLAKSEGFATLTDLERLCAKRVATSRRRQRGRS